MRSPKLFATLISKNADVRKIFFKLCGQFTISELYFTSSDPKPSQWHFKHCVYLPDLYHAHPDIVFCCGTYGQKTTDNCPANYIFWKVRFLFFRLLTGVIFRMMFGQDKMKNK